MRRVSSASGMERSSAATERAGKGPLHGCERLRHHRFERHDINPEPGIDRRQLLLQQMLEMVWLATGRAGAGYPGP